MWNAKNLLQPGKGCGSDFEFMLPTWFCSCHSWLVFVYRASGLCAVCVCNVIVLQNNMCLGIKRLCYVTKPCLFQPEDGAAEPSAALKHEQTLVRISFILFHPVNLNITPTQYTEKNNLIPYLYCALKKSLYFIYSVKNSCLFHLYCFGCSDYWIW